MAPCPLKSKILVFILVKENVLFTGKSPLMAPLIQCNIEIDLICLFPVNMLKTSIGQKYRP